VIRKILAEHDVGVEEYDLIVTSISTPSMDEGQNVSLFANEESVVRALADVDGATVSKLSKDLGLPFGVIQKTIDSLVRKGILEKSGSGSYHSTVTCHKKKDLTAPLPVSEINSTTRPFVESDDGALLMLLNSNPDNPDKDVWAELAVRGYEISVKSNGEFKISKLNGT